MGLPCMVDGCCQVLPQLMLLLFHWCAFHPPSPPLTPRPADLTCLIASPLMVGLVMQHAGGPPMVGSTLALLAWNMLAWPPELLLLRRAQRLSPALAADRPPLHAAGGSTGSAAGVSASGEGGRGRPRGGPTAWLPRQARPWAVYARQPAAAPALALALLYLTVLSWGTLMTAYLKAEGLPEAELALYRG